MKEKDPSSKYREDNGFHDYYFPQGLFPGSYQTDKCLGIVVFNLPSCAPSRIANPETATLHRSPNGLIVFSALYDKKNLGDARKEVLSH